MVKKVSQKGLHYFPLTHRLKRLCACRHTAKKIRLHYIDRPNEEGVLRHPTNGKVWKDFDINFPAFASQPKNVRLGLGVDGFNLFSNMSLPYSMWLMV